MVVDRIDHLSMQYIHINCFRNKANARSETPANQFNDDILQFYAYYFRRTSLFAAADPTIYIKL